VHVGATDILKTSGADVLRKVLNNPETDRPSSLVLKSHELRQGPKFPGHKMRASLDAVIFQDITQQINDFEQQQQSKALLKTSKNA
jgi:hypothetical protein